MLHIDMVVLSLMPLLAESPLFSQEALAGYLSTAVFTLISVGVMVFALQKALFKPLKNIVEKRQKAILDDLDKAKETNEKALEKEKKAFEELSQAHKKASEIITQAKEVALQKEEVILNQARKDARDILEKAEVEAHLLKTKALQETKKQIVELSLALASQVLSERLNEKGDEALIQRFLDEKIAQETEPNSFEG